MTDFDFDRDYLAEEANHSIALTAKELAKQHTAGELLTALEHRGMAIRAVYCGGSWYKPRIISE